MITEIDFKHFFVENKEVIPYYMISTLNPYTMRFFKVDKVYFATSFVNSETIEVCSTIGSGATGFREFLKSVKDNGIKKLTFGCSENNKTTQALYRYAGAVKTEEIPGYYSNGDACYRYELDLINNKRFNKLKEI